MTDKQIRSTRRSVLKSGVGASIAVTGMAGVAGAKGKGGGGRGLIVQTGDHRDEKTLNNPFTITEEVDDTDHPEWKPTAISPNCRGNSRPVDHTPYETTSDHWFFFPKNRNVNLGNEYEVVNYTKNCSETEEPEPREWIRVVVKPA